MRGRAQSTVESSTHGCRKTASQGKRIRDGVRPTGGRHQCHPGDQMRKVRLTWGLLLQRRDKCIRSCGLREDLQVSHCISVSKWSVCPKDGDSDGNCSGHLLVLPPAFIPPPPGSSPSTFLSRNTFCLFGYVLCGREEIPWPPQWAGDPHWANQMLSSYNLNLDQKDKRLTIVAETIAAPLKDCLFSTCCSDPQKCFLFYSPQA